MTDAVQIGLVILGIPLMALAVVKAWQVLGRRRHKPNASNNWVNEAYANRESARTWEKDG